MIFHSNLGKTPFQKSKKIKQLIDSQSITLGGNNQLKIYGKLTCTSGKRMKITNRVFFQNEAEAIKAGFRPCGHCMRKQYLAWKKGKKK